MKKKLTLEVVNEIQSWSGFENFDGTDLEYNCESHKIFSDGEISVLIKAINLENLSIIKMLCEAGANVNRVTKGTRLVPLTSFYEDCDKSFEISKLLIEYGADVNYYSKIDDFLFNNEIEFFNSPLTIACGIGNYQHIKLLINSGANINFSINPQGITAISCINMESSSYLEILQLFIEKGANVNNGVPLINATISGNKLAIELLLSVGALPNLCFNNKVGNGRSALMYLLDGYTDDLTHNKERYLFKILFENCKSINEQDSNGQSVLFYAINTYIGGEGFDIQCFDKIINHKKFDVNISDGNGNSILTKILLDCEEYGTINEEYFNDKDHYKISKLIALKAQTFHINKNKRTPMSIAEDINNSILIQLLKEEITPSFKLNNNNTITHNKKTNSLIKVLRYILFIPLSLVLIIYLFFSFYT